MKPMSRALSLRWSFLLAAAFSWPWVLNSSQVEARASDCSLEAEQYVGVGYSQPGELRGVLEDGNLVYEVRTNDQGGDAAYEVILTPSCGLVSKRLLWSE